MGIFGLGLKAPLISGLNYLLVIIYPFLLGPFNLGFKIPWEILKKNSLGPLKNLPSFGFFRPFLAPN